MLKYITRKGYKRNDLYMLHVMIQKF